MTVHAADRTATVIGVYTAGPQPTDYFLKFRGIQQTSSSLLTLPVQNRYKVLLSTKLHTEVREGGDNFGVNIVKY
jgi:hypothetical protein